VRDQVQAVLTAAGQRGWPTPKIYTEIGLPGWPRPGSVLARLAGYLASGRHDAIIVANLSRISRDPAEVDAQPAVQAEEFRYPPYRAARRDRQPELDALGRSALLDGEQAAQGSAVAEAGRGEVRDDDGRAGDGRRVELVVDLLTVD
jgi:hypothetical protein